MCGFIYNSRDMYELFGIKVEQVIDTPGPPPRERKVEIPGRQGAYEFDYGDYGERTLTLICTSARELTNTERREANYILSRKGRIILPREPDKYYTGRMYDPDEIEEIGQTLRKYTLTFTCEPFLRGAVKTITGNGAAVPISYAATAPTPCRIEIKNAGASPINVILVTHVLTAEV